MNIGDNSLPKKLNPVSPDVQSPKTQQNRGVLQILAQSLCGSEQESLRHPRFVAFPWLGGVGVDDGSTALEMSDRQC